MQKMCIMDGECIIIISGMLYSGELVLSLCKSSVENNIGSLDSEFCS